MARNKTREEKIKTAYKLHDFRIAEENRQEVKDANTFAYLDARFVRGDLLKTVVVSTLMVVIILLAQRYLG